MRLLVTPGDPRGIGPEVACRALAARPHLRATLIGDAAAIGAAAESARLSLQPVTELSDAPGVTVLDPGDGEEPVEVASIRLATHALLAGFPGALVTGPIHKARLAARGFGFPGHTDFLGHLCGVAHPVMAFTGGELRVALVTVHLPLRAVPDALTAAGILHTLTAAHEALRSDAGIPAPRLLVCGLNPHAGDEGLLGTEELEVIGPAVASARARGIDAVGPISAEAAFLAARQGRGDMVVAMYHDQGLAPLKAVDFGRSVNWTLGLPIIRTSVDHGTADDLVGTGRADPSSMGAALDWAFRLLRARVDRAVG